jgi:hypothetical protein
MMVPSTNAGHHPNQTRTAQLPADLTPWRDIRLPSELVNDNLANCNSTPCKDELDSDSEINIQNACSAVGQPAQELSVARLGSKKYRDN